MCQCGNKHDVKNDVTFGLKKSSPLSIINKLEKLYGTLDKTSKKTEIKDQTTSNTKGINNV